MSENKINRLTRKPIDYFLLATCITSTITFFSYLWPLAISRYKPYVNPDAIFTPDLERFQPEIEIPLYAIGWLLGILVVFMAYHFLDNYQSKTADSNINSLISKITFSLSLIVIVAAFWGYNTSFSMIMVIVLIYYAAIVIVYSLNLPRLSMLWRLIKRGTIALIGTVDLFILYSLIWQSGPFYTNLLHNLKDELLLTTTGYSPVEIILTILLIPVFGVLLLLSQTRIKAISIPRLITFLINTLVVLVIFFTVFDVHYSIYNINYVIGPVNDVLHGKSLLVDSPAQYGLLFVYGISAPFQFFHIPLTYGNFALLNTVIFVVSYIAIYFILRVWLKSILIALSGIFTIVLLNYFVLQTVNTLDFPQSGFMRFGWWIPIMALLLIRAKMEKGKTAKYVRNTLRFTELILVAIAFFWSLDSGMYVIMAYGAYILVIELSEQSSINITLRRLSLRLVEIVGALVLLFLIISVFTYLRSHQLPDWYQFIEYSRIYSSNGAGMIPMPRIGLHLLVIAVYMFATIYIILRIFFMNGIYERDLPILAFITVYGITQFVYYVGRSNITNLYHVIIPAIMVSCWFIMKGAQWIRAGNGRDFVKRNMPAIASVIILIALLVSLPILYASKQMILTLDQRNSIPELLKQRDNISWLIPSPDKQTAFIKSVDAIDENEKYSPKVAVVSTLDTWYLVATGKTNIMNSNNLPQFLLRSQIKQLGTELIKARPDNIYVDHDPLSPDFAMSYWHGRKVLLLMHMLGIDVSDANGENHAAPHNIENVQGVIGQASYFNGRNASIATSLNFQEWTNITISFWVKPEATETPGPHIILDNGHSTENNFVVQSIDNSETRFMWYCAGGHIEFDLPQQKWTHLIVMANGSNNKLAVYVNGKIQEEANSLYGLNFGSTPLTLGKWATVDARYFKGAIDEVAIWNYPLREDDIKILSESYKQGEPIPPAGNQLLSRAKALWHLDETTTDYRFVENVGLLDRYSLK